MDTSSRPDAPGPVGMLGGTFDPIHWGHLLLGEQAREQLGLATVLFVPSAQPPHKLKRPITDAAHRLAMTELAAAPNPHFSVSRRELDRPGPSYTITTIRELRAEGHARLFLIIGADALVEIMTWFSPDDIFSEAHVVAAPRPGFDLEQAREALGDTRVAQVRLLDMPLVDISASDIRRRVGEGRSIRYMVPDAVADYIAAHGLYAPGRS